MRVLWLCNIVLPELATIFGFRVQNEGGWLTGAWKELNKLNKYNMAICVPIRNPERMIDGENDGYKFYSFLTISNESSVTTELQISRFKAILSDYEPDVIHIWGTEYEHSYAMAKACEELSLSNKIVLNIQGLLTYCSKVYNVGIPCEIYMKKDRFGNSIYDGEKSFIEREKYEIETLKIVKNCIGRTDWDKEGVLSINPQIHYYHCGEILRQEFYEEKKWNYDTCIPNTIFVSQASYPIKGLHVILEGIWKLKQLYPNLRVNIGGENLYFCDVPYAKYITKQIDELNLRNTICFLGNLNARQMIEQYLNSNLFLSASLMENSSNSICEAMILGVPVVASNVGGTPSILSDGIEGLLYNLQDISSLLRSIDRVFKDRELCDYLSKNAINKTKEELNNRQDILKTIDGIYKIIGV